MKQIIYITLHSFIISILLFFFLGSYLFFLIAPLTLITLILVKRGIKTNV